MAFSAFRLMMAAGNSGSSPVILTDTITQEVAALVQNQTGPTYSINTAAASTTTSATTNVTLFSKGKGTSASYTWFTWLPTLQTAGPTFSVAAPLSVGTNSSVGTVDIRENVFGGVTTLNGEGSSLTLNEINSTNTAITATASHSMGQNSKQIRTTGIGTSFEVAMVFLNDNTSAIYLFDDNGPSYKSSAVGPSDISTQMSVIALASGLGAVVYNNSSNVIKYATFNISGTTISFDSAASSGITAASGAKVIDIDSSHMLMVYKKSSNTLAARVVTVVTGSSFTLGTEYTASATGITDDPIGMPGQFTGGGDYGVTWINASGQGCCTLMSVSGSVVTFSNAQIYHTANDVIANADYYSSYFIGMTSSKAAIAYYIKSSALSGQTALSKIVAVDLNYSTSGNTWNSTYAGNIQNSGALGLGAAVNLDADSLGTDRYIAIQTNNSTTVTLSTVDNDYSLGLLNTQQTFSAAAGANAGCIVNIGASGTTARALAFYGYSNTTVQVRLVQVDQGGGTITVGSAVTVTSAATTTATSVINAISYATDRTLIFYVKSTGLYAAIVTTSGTSTPTVANETQILSITNTNVNLGLTLLDTSGNIMLGYCDNGAHGQIQIVNVSGTTITTGTPVTLSTGSGVNGTITSCLHTASRGTVCFYDSGTPDVFVQGFTYSGTTITLGTSPTNVSNWGSGIQSSTSYKTNIASVGNNDAQVMFATSSNVLRSVIINTSGINTYSVSSRYGMGQNGTFYGFLPGDCYSKAPAFSANTSTSNMFLYNFYRV